MKYNAGDKVIRDDGKYGITSGTIREQCDDGTYIMRIWHGLRHVGDVVAYEEQLTPDTRKER